MLIRQICSYQSAIVPTRRSPANLGFNDWRGDQIDPFSQSLLEVVQQCAKLAFAPHTKSRDAIQNHRQQLQKMMADVLE